MSLSRSSSVMENDTFSGSVKTNIKASEDITVQVTVSNKSAHGM